MLSSDLYFLLLLLLVSQGFCDETDAQWQDYCKKLGQTVQHMTTELDQLSGTVGPAEEIIEKINKLKRLSAQLADCVSSRKENKRILLLAPLVMEHAHKIARFCQHLLIGGEAALLNSAVVIKERIRHGIEHTQARAVQIRQLLDTILTDWEVWPILYNFDSLITADEEEGRSASMGVVDRLVEELGQTLAKIRMGLARCGSYYAGSALDEALRQLMGVASAEGRGRQQQLKKLGQLWTIVPKLMAKAMLEMLDNVLADLFEPTSPFYGMQFLSAFAKEVDVAERVCADILRKSTLAPMERLMISDQFERLRDRANALFVERMKAVDEQLISISTMLKDEVEVFRMEKGTTIKRGQLINMLQKAQNLFVIVYNELDIIDLLGSSKMMEEKLAKLKHIMGQQQDGAKDGGGMPNDDDDVELTDEIESCLNVEKVEQRIAQEREYFAYKILF